jgi:hypothetical protein
MLNVLISLISIVIIIICINFIRECGSIVVKALRYKPEGRGFETRGGGILNLLNPSGRNRPWGSLSL